MTKVILVYPKWNKIPEQTEFHLPPHGPVCVAASMPEQYELRFIDENVDEIDFDAPTDLVMLSMMLTCQIPRGKEIAAKYRAQGVKVICGGID
ncbi:MAG: radical SAM protein, partial [Desulfobulbaceae bacterium]|nr:radical SAM protein [Desulfobulbaceae bacterium]